MSEYHIECKFSKEKAKVDDIYSQLDDYYFELKDRLIGMVNDSIFEKDIEFFLIKMFKLDDKDDSEFNVISYIEKMKKLNDELYKEHKSCCSNDIINKLLIKIDKLNDKIRLLSDDNEVYKQKLDKISHDLSNKSKIEFENLNINYNNQPVYHSEKRYIELSGLKGVEPEVFNIKLKDGLTIEDLSSSTRNQNTKKLNAGFINDAIIVNNTVDNSKGKMNMNINVNSNVDNQTAKLIKSQIHNEKDIVSSAFENYTARNSVIGVSNYGNYVNKNSLQQSQSNNNMKQSIHQNRAQNSTPINIGTPIHNMQAQKSSQSNLLTNISKAKITLNTSSQNPNLNTSLAKHNNISYLNSSKVMTQNTNGTNNTHSTNKNPQAYLNQYGFLKINKNITDSSKQSYLSNRDLSNNSKIQRKVIF